MDQEDDDDNKDSVNEIPFPSQGTLVASHGCELTGGL